MPSLDEYKKIADLLFPNITKTPEDYYKEYPERDLPVGTEVTRFAPSPTGYMHIGGVYQCLIDRAVAKSTADGVFFLRNEDTDSKREVEGAANIFVPALRGFGIEFDEGFVTEGEEKGCYGPYIQSHRKEIYQTFAKDLVSRGLAYPCFCAGENEEAKQEQVRLGLPLGYYGRFAKCRDLSLSEIEKNLAEGKPFTIRIKSNGDGIKRFKFHDLRIGDSLLPVNSNDYIILKSDGQTLYHLAHLVDDTLMHTTTVIRDESWYPSVPLHIQLFEYMNLPAPKYLHTPTVNTIDQETGTVRKVSKRKDSWADSRWFHEMGYPSNAIVDYLMNIINSNFEPWRESHPDSDIFEFDFKISNMSKSGALFDLQKIDNVSKNIVSRMDSSELYERTLAWAREYNIDDYNILANNKEYATKVLGMDKNPNRPRKDITTFKEVVRFYDYMFNETYTNDFSAFDMDKFTKETIAKVLRSYKDAYNEADTKDEWFARMKEVAGSIGFASDMKEYKKNPEAFAGSIADFSTIVRVTVTGRRQTPDLYEILQLLGRDTIMQRIETAISFLEN